MNEEERRAAALRVRVMTRQVPLPPERAGMRLQERLCVGAGACSMAGKGV